MGEAGLEIGLDRLAASRDAPGAVVLLRLQQVGDPALEYSIAGRHSAGFVQCDEGRAGGVSVRLGRAGWLAAVELGPAAVFALLGNQLLGRGSDFFWKCCSRL